MRRHILAAVAALCAGGAAHAATIGIEQFSAAGYNAALGGLGTVVTEDFESYGEGNVANGFATAVGSFSSVGGKGTGSTVSRADFANDGSQLAVRDGNVYGRQSSTRYLTGDRGDDMFLDSNDTLGIRWDVALAQGRMFDRILLTLADATDAGATMRITAGGVTRTLAGLGNGNKQTVLIDFGGSVSGATVLFENFRRGAPMLNDGFSIDDIAVAPVPLPASVLLLGAGLAGLAAMGRRRKA